MAAAGSRKVTWRLDETGSHRDLHHGRREKLDLLGGLYRDKGHVSRVVPRATAEKCRRATQTHWRQSPVVVVVSRITICSRPALRHADARRAPRTAVRFGRRIQNCSAWAIFHYDVFHGWTSCHRRPTGRTPCHCVAKSTPPHFGHDSGSSARSVRTGTDKGNGDSGVAPTTLIGEVGVANAAKYPVGNCSARRASNQRARLAPPHAGQCRSPHEL